MLTSEAAKLGQHFHFVPSSQSSGIRGKKGETEWGREAEEVCRARGSTERRKGGEEAC